MTTADLRDEQTSITRQRIVQALAELVTTEHPASVSVPEVARRAGVSVRTVYRYYPTKEQLLDGLSELGGEVTADLFARTDPGQPFSMEDYFDALPGLWRELHANAKYLRAQASNPLLRDTRSRRVAERRRRVAIGLHADDDLSEEAIERLTSLVQVLGSSWTMLDLTEEAGLDPEAAAALVEWAMRTLIEAARERHEPTGGGDAIDS